MAKKKTSVVLPGGISGLVNQLQAGVRQEVAPATTTDEPAAGGNSVAAERGMVAEQPAERKPAPAKATSKKKGSDTAKRTYDVVKDDSQDAWDLFLDTARHYKNKQGRLATIYIDDDMKRVLDRMKTAPGIKLPTAAILSSIVARFIYDHEQRIKDEIFGVSLL